MTVRKTPAEIRQECAAMVLREAADRERDGDPEGSGALRDLAARMRRHRLTKDA